MIIHLVALLIAAQQIEDDIDSDDYHTDPCLTCSAKDILLGILMGFSPALICAAVYFLSGVIDAY